MSLAWHAHPAKLVLAAMPVGVNVYVFGVRYHAGKADSTTAILL